MACYQTKKNEIPEPIWELVGNRLGYTSDETKRFRDNPSNAKVLQAFPVMSEKTIVIEVVESHGCHSDHGVGTRFYFSGDGNLITKMAPSRVCAFAVPVMMQMIFAILELSYAGVDPNELCFKRAGCFDVGVQCGGWGRIVVEARVMDKEEAKQLHQDDLKTLAG